MILEQEKSIPREDISPGRSRRIAHLEKLMVVVFDFDDGPMAVPEPPHSHPHEQITYVAEGELLFFKGSQKFHLLKGDIITIPAGSLHCIQTLTSHTRLVDSFCPLRDDFLKTNKQTL
jgi:quercetin dioxygenase-like cupin family protein